MPADRELSVHARLAALLFDLWEDELAARAQDLGWAPLWLPGRGADANTAPAGSAPAGAAHGQRDDDLARRVADLEIKLAAIAAGGDGR